MGTSWVALSIKNIKTRASREMTSRKNIKIFDFNGSTLPSTTMWRGEVFDISDCIVKELIYVARFSNIINKRVLVLILQKLHALMIPRTTWYLFLVKHTVSNMYFMSLLVERDLAPRASHYVIFPGLGK